MQLIIHDRRPLVAPPTGEPWLTIERKGTFSLSTVAAALLQLKATDEVVLAQDAETNAWFLILHPCSEYDAFELKPRDQKGKALTFCAQHRARAYYQAHGVSQEMKSVRSLVSATAIEHDGVKLYPLVPQHSTKTSAAAEPAAPVADAPVAAAPKVEQPVADVMPAPVPSFLDREPSPNPPMLATTPVVGTPEPIEKETTEQRMERLTDHWYERNIKECPDDELAELQSLLADKPKKERDIVENTVLNICKTERARRDKKGGARG